MPRDYNDHVVTWGAWALFRLHFAWEDPRAVLADWLQHRANELR